ncbi:hypothetical protein Dimus_029522 [Dionaea muscipula]
MSSPPREWSWEPRLPYIFDPSILEMTPLRIPSPALDFPEYTCQGSEESSFSSDESCPPCELGEGDAFCVSSRGVIPYALVEGDTARGSEGIPPSYPSATRLEGRSLRKLRIKLKSRSLGEPSQSCPETTTLCVVDVASTPGPLPGGEDIVPLEPSNDESPLKSSMRPAGLSYVGSEEAELQIPPLRDLSGIPSLDGTGMTKGRRLQLPSTAFVCGGRGRRGTGEMGLPDSLDCARVNTRDFDDHDRRSSCDAEDRPPKPPSTKLTREKEVANDYPRESQKRRQLTGPIDFQDPIGGRESVVPLGGSACGFISSMTSSSYAKERFKYEMVEGHQVELDPSEHILPHELRFAGP